MSHPYDVVAARRTGAAGSTLLFADTYVVVAPAACRTVATPVHRRRDSPHEQC
jgi:hypothetical protein